jgi:nucleotide-binding universal stress UspA family protein
MTTLGSALIGTDFSAEAISATHRAASIAGETGLSGALAHVLPGSLPVDLHLEAASRAQQALAVVADELRQAGASFAPRLLSGDVSAELVKAAVAFDLVVAGARGEDVIDFAMGRTSVRLVRQSGRPTLIVRRRGDAPYRRVLVATDFSAPSLLAAVCGAQIAPRADFDIVHAFEPQFESALRIADVSEERIQANRRQARDRAMAAMDAFQGKLPIAPGRMGRTVALGYPPKVILERAKEAGAQLIVIGKHAAGAIERAFVGSVSLQVLDRAECDVLVVPEAV